MIPDDDMITVNKKALFSLLLEMERQYAMENFYLDQYLTQIKQSHQAIHQLLENCRFVSAKNRLIQFLCPKRGEFDISDDLFAVWKTNLKNNFSQKTKANPLGQSAANQGRIERWLL